LAAQNLAARSPLDLLRSVLDLPEIQTLIREIEDARIVGRKGYGPRALLGACIGKTLYVLPTWTRIARLIEEHPELQKVLGGGSSP
jgi:hypothetical protein